MRKKFHATFLKKSVPLFLSCLLAVTEQLTPQVDAASSSTSSTDVASYSSLEPVVRGSQCDGALNSEVRLAVCASDYCNFLNDITNMDENFYDEKMSIDSCAGSIMRVGSAGGYLYFVVAGRENIPIRFLNEENRIAYCKWLQGRCSTTPMKIENNSIFQADDSLKSSSDNFILGMIVNESPMIMSSSNDFNVSVVPEISDERVAFDVAFGVFIGLACITKVDPLIELKARTSNTLPIDRETPKKQNDLVSIPRQPSFRIDPCSEIWAEKNEKISKEVKTPKKVSFQLPETSEILFPQKETLDECLNKQKRIEANKLRNKKIRSLLENYSPETWGSSFKKGKRVRNPMHKKYLAYTQQTAHQLAERARDLTDDTSSEVSGENGWEEMLEWAGENDEVVIQSGSSK